MCSISTASRRRRALNPRALDWRYPREVRKPPSRWVFNVWQMNSTEKRFRCSSMNRIISDVSGRVRMRKKPKRLSTTRWCPAALDFLDATVRFLQQGPRALIPQHDLRDERPASIASPCATRRPALVPRSCRLPAWKCSPPGCGLPRDGPHGPSHPDQIFSACSKFSHLLKRNKTWDTSLRSFRQWC